MSPISHKRIIKVDGAHNVRDLGGYNTPLGPTQWGRVLRSDSLHAISFAGVESLLNMGLKTVIDLRHPEEVAEEPNLLFKNKDIEYHNISLFPHIYPTPQQKLKEDLLLEIYLDTLRERASVFAQVIKMISIAPEGGVLFHCSAGKDRTGMVAALVLSAVGASRDVILEDYALTSQLIQPRLNQIIETAKQKGMDLHVLRSLMGSEKKTMESALDYLEREYGSTLMYLANFGTSEGVLEDLKKRLIEP